MDEPTCAPADRGAGMERPATSARDSGPPTLPYRVTSFYRALAATEDPLCDPIAAQFVPQERESVRLPYESTDPLDDRRYEVLPRVVHHYDNRVLILATDECAIFCRHCFRRHFTGRLDSGVAAAEKEASTVGASSRAITGEEIRAAAAYINKHPRITEVIVSGGDPLVLPEGRLRLLLSELREARRDLVIRVSTRVPVVAPELVSESLVGTLSHAAPAWLVVQVNHPREITGEFRRAVARFVDAGVPVVSQSVLLKGVNDSGDALEEMFRTLLVCRVKPYYLFQGDLAAGTSHFRTSIERGLELMRALRSRLSGLALPTYAVDLPGGGGKTTLTESTVTRSDDHSYSVLRADGEAFSYPREV